MKKKIFCTLFTVIFVTILPVSSQVRYQTDILNNQIKTLQVKVADQPFSPPYIKLDGDQQIEINFDALEHSYKRFAYSVIHCDADWQASSLSPIEYMNGFQGMVIDDFANSINTTVQYTNFRLFLPNEDVQLKVSGNYAVNIYEEGQPDQLLLTACFSVVEPVVDISSTVSSSTTIDFNKGHQQVSFSLHPKNFPIPFPQSDLKIQVLQNNRRDNMVTNIQPTTVAGNRIVYEYNRDLIFEAGNEYRRIEFLSTGYNGMGVNSIRFHNPYYHVELTTDEPRANRSYQYDQDQNGRLFVRCSSCNEPDIEADYYIVHFALACEPFLDGSVYLNGDLVNNILDDRSKMVYNFETGQYEKHLLLKAGNYNYQYLFVPKGKKEGSPAGVEGNYHEAENEYTIAVYYRPMGAHYDRLIGVAKTN
ncbi:MAG: DUF5103 domain-containing protein [Tannerellaceae bacterium]|nr:DUF5103 domain-containing protein [Tannerellaceae bacterium]